MSDQHLRIQWYDDYELHFRVDAEKYAPVAGPITVYFPLERRAFEQRFIPCPGLADRNSPEFAPQARRIDEGSRDTFSIGTEGIRTSDPCFRGITRIIDHLRASGGFDHVFHPSALPETRWDNIRLEQCSLSVELADYCKALESLYVNGFVECYGYQIAPGILEETVIQQRSWQLTPAFFIELFRHPLVRSDFSLHDVDERLLFARENWTYYSPFLFSGYLAQTLVAGGAYHSMGNDIGSALEIADKAFSGLNRNYQNLELYVCRKPWCHYFFDIAWDQTWVIFDREIRRLFVLIASDTD